jgi:hypothetical protein
MGIVARFRAPRNELPKDIGLPVAFRLSGNPGERCRLRLSIEDPHRQEIATQVSPLTIPTGDLDIALGVSHIPISLSSFGRYLVIADIENGENATAVSTWFYFHELSIH